MALAHISISIKETGSKGTKYNIEDDVTGELTLAQLFQYTKRAMISVAIDAFKEEKLKGFDPDPIIKVDGQVGKSIEDVKPFGKIEIISSKVAGTTILIDTYEAIHHRSKFVTGNYAKGNIVLFNGLVVATTVSELRTWLKSDPKFKPGNVIRFINVVPYARKLERYGVTAQRTSSRTQKSRDKHKRSGERILAPNGTYYLTYRAINRQYGNNAKIYFDFILGTTLGVDNLPGPPFRRGYISRKNKQKNSGPYLYPSIKIVVGEKGLI